MQEDFGLVLRRLKPFSPSQASAIADGRQTPRVENSELVLTDVWLRWWEKRSLCRRSSSSESRRHRIHIRGSAILFTDHWSQGYAVTPWGEVEAFSRQTNYTNPSLGTH